MTDDADNEHNSVGNLASRIHNSTQGVLNIVHQDAAVVAGVNSLELQDAGQAQGSMRLSDSVQTTGIRSEVVPYQGDKVDNEAGDYNAAYNRDINDANEYAEY